MTEAATGIMIPRTQHPEAQWFGGAGLGLFLHWGISSVHGGIDLSWGMMADTPWDAQRQNRNKVTPRRYFELAERFNPTRYDPLKWLEAARRAGFRYAVLTARHHDGYSMWPSAVGDFGVRTHLGGRDLVTPFVQACRRVGLKVGLYYSSPDWHFNRSIMSFRYGSGDEARFPGRAHYGLDHDVVDSLPAPTAEHAAAYHAYVRAQLQELLTGFGQIDLLWFDGPPAVMSIDEIRALQSAVVINPRMHGSGDFLTLECEMPNQRPEGWWELCESLQEGSGWGYESGAPYRSAGWMLARLAQVRGWGGNYLINVGPGPEGELPPSYYERMEELACWVQHSGRSIIDVGPRPAALTAPLPVTTREDTWYVHLLPGRSGSVEVRLPHAPRSVALLRTGDAIGWAFRRAEASEAGEGKLAFDVPGFLRTRTDDVVEIRF